MGGIPVEVFEGCLLSLALGDALGAPYEGGPIERLVWWFIGTTKQGESRWTDDTQMAVDIAESLISKGTLDPDDLAARFASSYRWSRGYGPAAGKLLKRIARGESLATGESVGLPRRFIWQRRRNACAGGRPLLRRSS